jgi:hypothetical protein
MTATQSEYVHANGTICPQCGGGFLTYGDSWFEHGEAVREASCDDCDISWQEVYVFSSIKHESWRS